MSIAQIVQLNQIFFFSLGHIWGCLILQIQLIIRPMYSPPYLSARKIKSAEPKQQEILVTYNPSLQKLIFEAFNRISKEYASVYIITKKQQNSQVDQKLGRKSLLSKRTVKNINLVQFSQKVDDKMYQCWLHYSNDQSQRNFLQSRYSTSMKYNYVGEDEDVNSIFRKATKLINLDFIWLGVGGRIGCSINQFELAVNEFQIFQRHEPSFLVEFFSKLNQHLQLNQNGIKQRYPEEFSQKIKNIFDKCIKQSEQISLKEEQQEINQLLCQGYSQHIFVLNLTNHNYYKILKTRNFFKSIWIEEPAVKRYTNFKNLLKTNEQFSEIQRWISQDISNFLLLDDYIYEKFLQRLAHEAHFVINTGITKHVYKKIIEQNYQHIFRKYRPDFDEYFISLCEILKIRSGCIKEAVGAIIVRNKRILSTGYNGTPMGSINCYNGGCRVCNDSKSLNTVVLSCNCIHAEYSCIIEAGIESTPGCTLYSTQFPCLWCAKVICQAKISEIVYIKNSCSVLTYENEARVRDLLKEAKIEVREFNWQEGRFSKI